MARILLVPEWMGHVHWLIIMSIMISVSIYSTMIYLNSRTVRAVLYMALSASLGVISGCFWLIQVGISGAKPETLFIIERAFWWPATMSMILLVDLHAAELNGHRSILTRIYRRFERRGYRHETQ